MILGTRMNSRGRRFIVASKAFSGDCTELDSGEMSGWTHSVRSPIRVVTPLDRTRVQTHKSFNRTLFIRTKTQSAHFGGNPFVKLQNDT